jgi:hypothetical protein
MSIEFRVSQDSRLLEQYYSLRERCYRAELGLPGFDGSEEEQDRQGQIILAVQNDHCIGGVRISPTILLQSHIQQLKLNLDTCCMWERFVFDPAVRSVQLIREFVDYLITASQETGYHHAMMLSSLRNARFYRQCHTALGVEFEIHRNVPHCADGKFAGLEHILSISSLQSRPAVSVSVKAYA